MKNKTRVRKRSKTAKKRSVRKSRATKAKVKRRLRFDKIALKKKRKNVGKRQVIIAPKLVRFIDYIFKKVEIFLHENQLGGDSMQSASCPCINFLNNATSFAGMGKKSHLDTKRAKQAFSERDVCSPCKGVPRSLISAPTIRTRLSAFSNTRREGLKDLPVRGLRNSKQARPVGPISSILFPSAGPIKCDDRCRESSKSSYARNAKQDIALTPCPSGSALVSAAHNQTNVGNFAKIAPMPSGEHQPTFIAMVKTAIRDLRPYKMTSKDAISRYIHLRYQVHNDTLLRYVLDWMEEMKILRACHGNYLFSKKRVVKKTKVAVCRLRKKDKSRTRVVGKSSKRKKKKRGEKRRSSKNNDSNVNEVSQSEKLQTKRKKKQRKVTANDRLEEIRRKKAVKNKKKQSTWKEMKEIGCDTSSEKDDSNCFCENEISSVKNRVKLGSRYTRHGGKLYKEDEYI